jgi:hypothetical protein
MSADWKKTEIQIIDMTIVTTSKGGSDENYNDLFVRSWW